LNRLRGHAALSGQDSKGVRIKPILYCSDPRYGHVYTVCREFGLNLSVEAVHFFPRASLDRTYDVFCFHCEPAIYQVSYTKLAERDSDLLSLAAYTIASFTTPSRYILIAPSLSRRRAFEVRFTPPRLVSRRICGVGTAKEVVEQRPR